MEMLLKNLDEERKRFSEQMESERKAHQGQLDNMMATSMKQAQEERQAFIQENQELKDRFLAMHEHNENNVKMIKKLSEMAAKRQEEENELRRRMKAQADEDNEALVKKLNEKHDEEMKALRDEMNAKLDEVIRQAPPIEPMIYSGTPGLIKKRAKEADSLHGEIQKTSKEQGDVEKPGFLKKALQFVGKLVVPAVGAVVSAVAPIAAPIAAPLAAGASFVADTFCSIM